MFVASFAEICPLSRPKEIASRGQRTDRRTKGT